MSKGQREIKRQICSLIKVVVSQKLVIYSAGGTVVDGEGYYSIQNRLDFDPNIQGKFERRLCW